jgi:hypothetical protein
MGQGLLLFIHGLVHMHVDHCALARSWDFQMLRIFCLHITSNCGTHRGTEILKFPFSCECFYLHAVHVSKIRQATKKQVCRLFQRNEGSGSNTSFCPRLGLDRFSTWPSPSSTPPPPLCRQPMPSLNRSSWSSALFSRS